MDWRLVCPSAAHIARVCPSVRHITWRHEREGAVVRQSRVFGVVADAVVLDGFLQPPTSGQTAHENAIEELRHLGTLARILTSSNFTPMLTDAHACAPGHVCVCTQTDIHSRTRTSRHQTRENKRDLVQYTRDLLQYKRDLVQYKRGKDLSLPDRTSSNAGLTCVSTFVERPESVDFESFSLFCDGFGATFPLSFLILMLLSPILVFFFHVSSESHAAHVHFCSPWTYCAFLLA